MPVLGIVREPTVWSVITSLPSLKDQPDEAVTIYLSTRVLSLTIIVT